MQTYKLNHLQELEAESLHILREVAATFSKPVLLYSIGKDSSVLLHLARKAFVPGKIPFPLLHIDTGFKFDEMIRFRDETAKKMGVELLVHKNESEEARLMTGEDAHTERYIYHKKTKPLLDALKQYGFDAAIGGARREEEKSRAKERIFSFRNEQGNWDPKGQRPELWHLYNTQLGEDESMRVFPLSNWTEIDIWQYIKEERIEVVPLYFAEKRRVIRRNGVYLRIDHITKPKAGEPVEEITCRYRTLGCSPSTGAVKSEAMDLDQIIEELKATSESERITRAIDHNSQHGMEQKKKEGYF